MPVIPVRAGDSWKTVIEVELSHQEIVRLTEFLNPRGDEQLVHTSYHGSFSQEYGESAVETWAIVGADGIGKRLRRERFETSPSELLRSVDAIYLCEPAGRTDLRYVIADVSKGDSPDRRSLTLICCESEFLDVYQELGMGGSGGALWRGASLERPQSILDADYSGFSFGEGVIDELVLQTVGFLHGEVAETLRHWDLPPKRGVLLHGEPGNGKTVLTRICAKRALQAGLNVSIVEGRRQSRFSWDPQALGIGDELRTAAARGQGLLIFEDIDLHCRSRVEETADRTASKVEQGLIDLLDFLDGFDETDGYVLVATTNHPERIDPALLRPGRFDVVRSVPPPDDHMRAVALQRMLTPGPQPAPTVDDASALLKNVSFAELAEVARRYKLLAANSGGHEPTDALLFAAARSLVEERYPRVVLAQESDDSERSE